MTQDERDYFQSIAQQQVNKAAGVYAESGVNSYGASRRKAPVSPFVKNSAYATPLNRKSDAQASAQYADMSEAQQKDFDEKYDEMISKEIQSVAVWGTIPDGTIIQPSSSGGYTFIADPSISAVKPGTPQSWIDDFQNQIAVLNKPADKAPGAAPASQAASTL
jgi:hypothetical protein